MNELLEPTATLVATPPVRLQLVRQLPDSLRVVYAPPVQSINLRQVQTQPTVLRRAELQRVIVGKVAAPGIVRLGEAGPQGIPGPAAGNATITVVADENMTYPCVVAIANGYAHYADPANPSDMTSELAITTQAALAGANVVCAKQLSVTEVAWSWTPGRVFLSTTPGQLTQTVGSAGAVLEVGRASSPTTIDFAIETAILR